jgi:flagellum-specific peptidoglycan hydrolase FlgJ
MKKFSKKLGLTAGLALSVLVAFGVKEVSADTTNAMYRLYNPNSGEHFYTANFVEAKNTINAGWRYEGVGWQAPTTGAPVYRLYNPNVGDHHYTMNIYEKEMLVSKGWHYESIGWYSDAQKRIVLYRAYNPNKRTGTHNYTANSYEQISLLQAGWRDEGAAWYGSPTAPLENKDSVLQDLSKGYKGIDEVLFDRVTPASRRDWLYQTIKSSVPLAADGRLFPSVMVAQAILESGWGESGLTVQDNNLFGLKKGSNWQGAVAFWPTAEQARSNGVYTGYPNLSAARAGGPTQQLNLKTGDYYYVRAPFRKYGTQQESLADYVKVLSQSGYADARRTSAKNYKAAATALGDEKPLSWATSIDYTNNIIRTIEYYNLQALD